MLRLIGIRLHPGLRALAGMLLVVLGLVLHRAGFSIVGGLLLLWAVLGLLGLGGASEQPQDEPTYRHFR